MARPLNILISGSGIAGGAFARFLLKANKDANITIVEKAPGLRLSGASVDIREAAVQIIKEMGIEQEILDNTTKETGTSFVRADGSFLAYFGATGDVKNQGITSEYEIFRGALAHILIKPALPRIKLIYDETIESYEQVGDKVHVSFASKREESYDLLVAADGVGSKIRARMLGAPAREHIYDTGARVAFFTIKRDMLEGRTDGLWRSIKGSRSTYLRPDPHPEGRTRGHFMISIPKDQQEKRERFDKALAAGNDATMSLFEEEFADSDWLSPQVLKEMRKSDDFYASLFGQVRSPRLEDGRVVLLGDAGYATPGIGTSFAITGAYVLAGELLNSSGDVEAATKAYEDFMLPLVRKEQMDFNVLALMSPYTQLGINIRDTILWTMSTLKVFSMVSFVMNKLGLKQGGIDLPKYQWPQEVFSTEGKNDM